MAGRKTPDSAKTPEGHAAGDAPMREARALLVRLLPKALRVFDEHMDHADPRIAQSAAKEILQRTGLSAGESDSEIVVRFDAAMRRKKKEEEGSS